MPAPRMLPAAPAAQKPRMRAEHLSTRDAARKSARILRLAPHWRRVARAQWGGVRARAKSADRAARISRDPRAARCRRSRPGTPRGRGVCCGARAGGTQREFRKFTARAQAVDTAACHTLQHVIRAAPLAGRMWRVAAIARYVPLIAASTSLPLHPLSGVLFLSRPCAQTCSAARPPASFRYCFPPCTSHTPHITDIHECTASSAPPI